MHPDWLKALELPTKITGGVFAASVVTLMLNGSDALNLDDIGVWAQPSVMLLMILAGFLFLFGIIPQVWEASASYRLKRQRKTQHAKLVQDFIADIPFLTKRERQILGYLRHHRQKRFVAASDGGHANTLISKEYVQFIGKQGQIIDAFAFPFEVASYVWKEIEARPEEFPHSPIYSDRSSRKVEVYPWREVF